MDNLVDLEKEADRLPDLLLKAQGEIGSKGRRRFNSLDGSLFIITKTEKLIRLKLVSKPVRCSRNDFLHLIDKLVIKRILITPRDQSKFKIEGVSLENALDMIKLDRALQISLTTLSRNLSGHCHFNFAYSLKPESDLSFFRIELLNTSLVSQPFTKVLFQQFVLTTLIKVNTIYGQEITRKLTTILDRLRDIPLPEVISRLICSYLFG